jgi:hypothetical protein
MRGRIEKGRLRPGFSLSESLLAHVVRDALHPAVQGLEHERAAVYQERQIQVVVVVVQPGDGNHVVVGLVDLHGYGPAELLLAVARQVHDLGVGQAPTSGP